MSEQVYDIKEILQSLADLRIFQAETSKQIRETSEQMKETDRQFKETDRKFKEMGIKVEGMSKTAGEEAEEFFYSALAKKPSLGTVLFDDIEMPQKKQRKGENFQIDILMTNGNAVGVVEVKHKARIDDIAQLDKQVSEFYKFYPYLQSMKVYGGIAAKIMPKSVEQLALSKGYYVLKQQGNHMEVIPPAL